MRSPNAMLGAQVPGSGLGESAPSGLGGSIGSLLGSLFGRGKNPADSAMPYLNQIPGTLSPYFQPYINAGLQDLGTLQGQYGQLLNDPGALMAKFGSGYQQSPGFKWQLGQGESAINNAAAAGGMLGSNQHQQQAGQLANNLANQDYYNYLNHVLGMYGQGLSGMQGVNQMGFGASTDLANSLAQNLQSEALLKYMGQDWKNQQNQGFWSGMGNLIGDVGKSIPFIGGLF